MRENDRKLKWNCRYRFFICIERKNMTYTHTYTHAYM